MKKKISLLGTFVFLTIGFCANNAQASQIVVSDCEGAIRAVGDDGDSSNNNVIVELVASDSDSLEDTLVTLSNGTDTRSASSVDGKMTFEQIGAGRWKACVDKKNVSLGNVLVSRANPSSSVGPLALLGAGLAGATGIAVGGLSSGSSDSSSNNGIPSALVGSGQDSSLANAASGNNHPVAAAAGKGSLMAEDDCKTNELPDVLSPFL